MNRRLFDLAGMLALAAIVCWCLFRDRPAVAPPPLARPTLPSTPVPRPKPP